MQASSPARGLGREVTLALVILPEKLPPRGKRRFLQLKHQGKPRLPVCHLSSSTIWENQRYACAQVHDLQRPADADRRYRVGQRSRSACDSHSQGDASAAFRKQPDVIVFNEVFSEVGRDTLHKGLLPGWPHVAYKLDACFLDQDSGLLLMSRIPFATMPANMFPFPSIPRSGNAAFFRYNDSAGADALACKGVGIVQLQSHLGLITLAFSHLQASYEDTEDMHRDVREKQMAAIEGVLKLLMGADTTSWPATIVMGDLNIRGDPQAKSDEWNTTFSVGASAWATDFLDGWRSFMRPPGASLEIDSGFTNNDLESGLLSRLDYQIFNRPERVLEPQHMFTRLRGLSDHWALESVVHVKTPHCTPSDAIQIGPVSPTGWVFVHVELKLEGSYQWIVVRDPGTYSIFVRREVEAILYSADDLSDPLRPIDESDLRLMAHAIRLQEAEQHRLGPKGVQYAPAGPFFILIRSNPRGLTGVYTGISKIGVLRHRGASAAKAIFLHPWDEPTDPELPEVTLGDKDTCWFRAAIGRAHSHAPHTSHFFLQNASAGSAAFDLLDNNFQRLGSVTQAGDSDLAFTIPGPETVYLNLRRDNLKQNAFKVSWQGGLTYMRDDKSKRPIALRAIDETGLDWPGADEIRLKLFVDNQIGPFFEIYWDDADTGEALPLQGQFAEFAFVNSVVVEVDEEGDISASSPGVGIVNPLGASDGPIEERMVSIPVQSGTYRFECTLARKPSGR